MQQSKQKSSSDMVVTIYPSDIEAARDAAIKVNPKDVNGYAAFRISIENKTQNKVGNTTYVPFEVNLGERGWHKVIIKFLNLKHVGKIAPLEDRIKGKVQDISLLFKGDYTFERVKTDSTGKKVTIIERYGLVKDYVCKAYMAHVRKYQIKNQLFSNTQKIIPNVKHTKEVKDKFGNITYENLIPANINVSIPFEPAGPAGDAYKKDGKTKFKTLLLDATKEKKNVAAGAWPFEVATISSKIKGDDGSSATIEDPINNGNIHLFLRGGSLISGFDNMSDICISQGGISLPSKLDTAIVKQGTMARVGANNFDSDDFASIKGAQNVEEPKSNADGDSDFGAAGSAPAGAPAGVVTTTASADEFGSDDFTPSAPVDDLEF
jgi:hypothetical protein